MVLLVQPRVTQLRAELPDRSVATAQACAGNERGVSHTRNEFTVLPATISPATLTKMVAMPDSSLALTRTGKVSESGPVVSSPPILRMGGVHRCSVNGVI